MLCIQSLRVRVRQLGICQRLLGRGWCYVHTTENRLGGTLWHKLFISVPRLTARTRMDTAPRSSRTSEQAPCPPWLGPGAGHPAQWAGQRGASVGAGWGWPLLTPPWPGTRPPVWTRRPGTAPGWTPAPASRPRLRQRVITKRSPQLQGQATLWLCEWPCMQQPCKLWLLLHISLDFSQICHLWVKTF